MGLGISTQTSTAAPSGSRGRLRTNRFAGVLARLKAARLMLKDTLVILGACEFGTPAVRVRDGRKSQQQGLHTWMAGVAVKGGFSYGATDSHGYESGSKINATFHDWHATISALSPVSIMNN